MGSASTRVPNRPLRTRFFLFVRRCRKNTAIRKNGPRKRAFLHMLFEICRLAGPEEGMPCAAGCGEGGTAALYRNRRTDRPCQLRGKNLRPDCPPSAKTAPESATAMRSAANAAQPKLTRCLVCVRQLCPYYSGRNAPASIPSPQFSGQIAKILHIFCVFHISY